MNAESLILLLLFILLAGQPLLLYRVRTSEIKIQQVEQRLRDSQQEGMRNLFNQFESYSYLRDRLKLRDGMPYTTDWSAAPDFLKIITEHCLEHNPKTIVECSSGLTTVMLARCCELNGQGKVYSLENGKEYAEISRQHLERYRLQQWATVIHAPLQNYTLGDADYQWYALDQLPDKSIDMLVIDGPPGFIQKHSRYPALPLLKGKLADGCAIFLDDAVRPDEKEIVEMWRKLLPGVELDYISTERGCATLTLR